MTSRRLSPPAAALILAAAVAAPALAQGVPDGQQAPAVVAPPAQPAPQGANPPAAPPGGAPTAFQKIAPSGDIERTLSGSGQFQEFLKAVNAANLMSVLKKPGITVFAPTDAAFAAASPSQKAALTASDHGQRLLAYHIINAPVPASALKGAASPVASAVETNVYLDGTKTPPMVNDANILQSGVAASNGQIYVIDRVLDPTYTPPAGAPAAANSGK